MKLTRNTEPRKDAYLVYHVEGLRGTIYIPKSMVSGEAATEITLDGLNFVEAGKQAPTAAAKAKMTPEEKEKAKAEAKAARAAETPADKAARAADIAAKATARAKKLAEAAAAATEPVAV